MLYLNYSIYSLSQEGKFSNMFLFKMSNEIKNFAPEGPSGNESLEMMITFVPVTDLVNPNVYCIFISYYF